MNHTLPLLSLSLAAAVVICGCSKKETPAAPQAETPAAVPAAVATPPAPAAAAPSSVTSTAVTQTVTTDASGNIISTIVKQVETTVSGLNTGAVNKSVDGMKKSVPTLPKF